MSKRYSHRKALFSLVGLTLFLTLGATAQAQFRIAPIKSIGETITCRIGAKSYELRPAQGLIAARSFMGKTAETQSIFDKVSPFTKLRINIYTVPVEDDINVEICPGDVNYIAYNAVWLTTLYKETNNQWALSAVIAHETGHYALSHDRTSLGSEPGLELEADEYAGEVLARMGASLADAQAAYRSKIMDAQDHTHPPIEERLAAVERGWRKIRTVERPVERIAMGPVELKDKDTAYKGGLNNESRYKFKIASVQFNDDDGLLKAAINMTDQATSHVWDNKTYYWSGKEGTHLLLVWKNRTENTVGWALVENYKGEWYYKTNGSKGEWTKLERDQRHLLHWDDSGQKIDIILKAPNLSEVWTKEDIQYSFGYSN
ncbi:MAG: M48 family metalloprotease [Chitinophagaceae bacterium]